jgi:hypothetical protein
MSNRRFPADHALRFLEAQLPYGWDWWAWFDLAALTDEEVWCLGLDELSDADLRAQSDELAEVPLTLEQWRCLARHELTIEDELNEGLSVQDPRDAQRLIPTQRANRMPWLALRLSDADVATLHREMGLPDENVAF